MVLMRKCALCAHASRHSKWQSCRTVGLPTFRDCRKHSDLGRAPNSLEVNQLAVACSKSFQMVQAIALLVLVLGFEGARLAYCDAWCAPSPIQTHDALANVPRCSAVWPRMGSGANGMKQIGGKFKNAGGDWAEVAAILSYWTQKKAVRVVSFPLVEA
eukprot:5509442-Amphidinium_carterae.2